MGQESFIYSFVARGTMVLAEYTEFTGNFPAIAAQCLQRLPSTNNKFTYKCDHHNFNFLVEDGYGRFPIPVSISFAHHDLGCLNLFFSYYLCWFGWEFRVGFELGFSWIWGRKLESWFLLLYLDRSCSFKKIWQFSNFGYFLNSFWVLEIWAVDLDLGQVKTADKW